MCLVSSARELVATSDALDQAERRAIAAWSEGYRAGTDATKARARAEGYAAAVADFKRTNRELVAALGECADQLAARWRLYCPVCRLLSEPRPRCGDCQARTPETFAEPMPGEYLGGPVCGWSAT